MRFSFPAIGCELAQVADILIIAGDEKSLAPFRETRATFLVDRIDEFIAFLSRQGGEIIRGPQNVPTGINCTIRHPDGTVIEYVEHKKQESNKEKEHA